MKKNPAFFEGRPSEWPEPSVEITENQDPRLIEIICEDCDPDRFSEKLYAAMGSAENKLS